MINKRIELFTAFGNTLPHAKVYHREDWDVLYFDLQGKQFGLMSKDDTEEGIITLKGDPETNDILRENYEDIIPGFYANKKHWNSIYLKTTALTDEEIKEMIKKSYDLVWKNLPAKTRKELA